MDLNIRVELRTLVIMSILIGKAVTRGLYSDSSSSPGILGFMTGKQSVNESSGVVNVQVIRTHGLMGKVTVNWKSLAVKASHGKDYDGSTGKLIFGENQTFSEILIPIKCDDDQEGNEHFEIELMDPYGGAKIGRHKTNITILDDCDEFVRIDNKYCAESYGTYNTTEEAKEVCRKDVDCKYIFDDDCDGIDLKLCSISAKFDTSCPEGCEKPACTYIKETFKSAEKKSGCCISNNMFHSNCKCTNITRYLDCISLCSLDKECKGFAIAKDNSFCDLATTNIKCPDQCDKIKYRSNTGNLDLNATCGEGQYQGCLLKNDFRHCNQEIILPTSEFMSPNYPNKYPHHQDCKFVIRMGNNQTLNRTIKLEFVDFNLEKYEECRYDWIEIRDGKNENDPLIGNRLCGSKRPAPIVSSGNTLFMHFHSDNRGSAKGFKARPEINCVRVDCDLDEWNQWTQCKACGEPRQRNRTIKRKEECGGSSCLNFQQMEEQTCPNTCATDTASTRSTTVYNNSTIKTTVALTTIKTSIQSTTTTILSSSTSGSLSISPGYLAHLLKLLLIVRH